jgi:hypothetical protein
VTSNMLTIFMSVGNSVAIGSVRHRRRAQVDREFGDQMLLLGPQRHDPAQPRPWRAAASVPLVEPLATDASRT